MSADQGLDIFNTRFHNPSIFAIRERTRYQGALTDFCVPANSYFPPEAMLASIRAELPDILKYYPDYAEVHQDNIARVIDVPAEHIVAANGVTELITLLCQDAEGPIATCVPTFGRWTDLPVEYQVPVQFIMRDKARDFRLEVREIVAQVRSMGARTLVISNPNNPTGAWLEPHEVTELVMALQDLSLILIDESFMDFAGLGSAEKLAMSLPNVMVVKSMGKSLGWHGVRLGYGVANANLARQWRARLPYWNINGLAAFVLKHLPNYKAEYAESFRKVAADREYMYQRLQEVPGLRTYPSRANFLLSELPEGVSGKALRNVLLQEHGLVVRECSNKVGSSEQFLRNVVRRPPDTDKLIAALQTCLPDFLREAA